MNNIALVDLKTQYFLLEKEIIVAIKKVFRSTSFILGEEVDRFEKNFASYCQAKYCVGLDNGSSALELGLRALEIGKGDEVITPVNSFIASSYAISIVGAKPVWVDCDKKTYNIDVAQIENRITKKTKAIMPVHLYGQPADLDPLLAIAKKYKLYVIEDACQAHGAKYKNKRVGTFGAFAAFSFYPGKNLGAFGDAGALVTNNKNIYEVVKKMRNYGQSQKYYHETYAFNRRLDTLQAAVLNIKLKFLDEWNQKRREYANLYNSLLEKLPVIRPLQNSLSTHIYHLYVIRLRKRDQLQNYLSKHLISTGIHYPIPIHLQKIYKNFNGKVGDYPVSEKYAKEILSLPMYPHLKEQQISYIVDTIKNFDN